MHSCSVHKNPYAEISELRVRESHCWHPTLTLVEPRSSVLNHRLLETNAIICVIVRSQYTAWKHRNKQWQP